MNPVPQSSYAQELYNNAAGKGTDKDVTSAVMLTINKLLTPPATHVPVGNDMIPVNEDIQANAQKALAAVQKIYASQATGYSSLVLLGETHNDQPDQQRAVDFINAINNGTLNPTLIVFERGMTYPTPNNGLIIRETNLTTVQGGDFGMGLSKKQRSMVVAGYLVLLHAGGNQQDINRDLLFYGDNHQDIFTYFDYFARHSAAFYLLKMPRGFIHVRPDTK